MKKGRIYKSFVYFLIISLLLLMNGFHSMIAEAKEKGVPIGEMISKGEVNYEARENVWKKVDSSYFPVFQGVKIKTEKGVAAIALGNNSRIEVGQNSLFSFDQNDLLHLFQGQVNFSISPTTELNFKIGSLTITKSRSLQASKGSGMASPKNEETIGSISIHFNGAVTVKSIQGELTVLNEDRVVVATVSSQDSVTVPSNMVAQAGGTEKPQSEKDKGGEGWTFLGIGGIGWVLIAGGTTAVSLAAMSGFATGPVRGAGCLNFLLDNRPE